MLLGDNTAIVTGGASGIGRSIALTFADHGANVIVADLHTESKNDGETEATHELINATTNGSASFVKCNISEPADIDAAIEATEEFGGLDVMINNAGVFDPGNFFETTSAEYDRTMAVNAKGMYFASQRAAQSMAESGGGTIINISSIAGILGNGRYVKYTMSKGAVRMLTYSLADFLGPHDIRVNAIHPGSIDTGIVNDTDEEVERAKRLIPSRRIGLPEDIANVALFLASDLSSYVNGESIIVDGGYTNTGSPRWDVKNL